MAKVNFTAKRVEAFTCPEGKQQALIFDAGSPGLGLRVTASGAKAYIFQGDLFGKTIRHTIGDTRTVKLGDAQEEAARLKQMVKDGKDPRTEKAEQRADHEAKQAAKKLKSVTFGEAWADYLADRAPVWGARHYQDHVKKTQAPGVPHKRGVGTTKAGPLHCMMRMRLADVTDAYILEWAAKEAKEHPAVARLAWRLLKGFFSWCTEHEQYKLVIDGNPAKRKKTREKLGSGGVKTDALQREQLPQWFAAIRAIPNPVMSAYLQGLLLNGARRDEFTHLRWGDIDFEWGKMTIRDKVDGERTISLTPYMASLLKALPRVENCEWVFSSPTAKDGRMNEPLIAHTKALADAGLPHVTLHGLRRSFKSLTEWIEMPVGVVAQIMGHKPSATAEKHYTVRPIDLLRLWHTRIEAWMLEQGDVAFEYPSEKAAVREVKTRRAALANAA